IKSLPEDMRAAIILRDIQGFSYDQIAAILKANVGTIKSRISRGREKLREIIRQETELFEKYSV
ncbi:MAG: sigma factor-like helix-turn-helix DNA-binding protein, partial [Clostridia bacterium]|nr:sigma factor-like helix-turn-helix DNA-binding protein [Clostridia bacterium]